MGLLSGLGLFGLGELESADLYEKQEKKNKEKEKVEVKESDLLFDKTYTCPICDNEFKTKTVRAGKARLLGTDLDLRPRYENIDMLKYDTVVCPNCGYAALSRYFKFMTSVQSKLIRTGICAHFVPHLMEGDTYTYEEALERYKLILANAIVKHAKPSEKAYICLKSAWLLRGMAENLPKTIADYDKRIKAYEDEENEYLKNSLEGFLAARQTESFPMCGMDETTVDYLIAVLAMHFEQYDVSVKLVSGIITSRGTNSRMKDKARDLKDLLMKKMKEQKEA